MEGGKNVNTNKRFFVVGVACFALAMGAWFLRAEPAHGQGPNSVTNNEPSLQTPWGQLESKARAARNGDHGSVRALADQIFDQWNGFGQVPAELSDAIKERLVRAEINYRQGKSSGVEESNIVKMNNALVGKLGMPDYMKLGPQQVRQLRLSTLTLTPFFMGMGMTRKNMKVGEKINSTMSPLQAAHLVTFLVQQKLVNPDFQLTPQDWNARQYEQHMQRWQAYQQARASGGKLATDQANSQPQLAVRENPKKREILGVFENAQATMTPDDALQLANGALDTLGIER
jgi:hypothetical protein